MKGGGGRRPSSDRKGRERDRGNERERERDNRIGSFFSLLYLENIFLIVRVFFSNFNAPS